MNDDGTLLHRFDILFSQTLTETLKQTYYLLFISFLCIQNTFY